MTTSKLLNTLQLSNGLKVSIFDHTKVYFGDYHHVRIQIYCCFDDTSHTFINLFSEGIDIRNISYKRTLEKMGVPSAEIENVIKALLDDFEFNSLPYISSQEFTKKMIENSLSKKAPTARKYLEAVL